MKMKDFKTSLISVLKRHRNSLIREMQGRVKAGSLREANADISEYLQEICKRKSLFKLLIILRKFPHYVIAAALHEIVKNLPKHSGLIIISEATMFATNYALAFSKNENDVLNISDRDTFDFTEDTMLDALRVILLSSIHRYHNFRLRTGPKNDSG